MNTQALELIEKCLQTKDPYLDVGNCGLTDEHFITGSPIDQALRKCTHLHTLILSNEWYERDKQQWRDKSSQNKGDNNQLVICPPALS